MLFAAVILELLLIAGCETENPVSALQAKLNSSLQKSMNRIVEPGFNNFYVSFKSSGGFSGNQNTSILEILGNSNISGIGDSKIFSFSKINSNTQTGSLDITTANGDRITGSLSGTIQINPGNILFFSGKYRLTGGTGKFSRVTGNGNYSGNFYKNTSAGKFILNGIISQPEIIRLDSKKLLK